MNGVEYEATLNPVRYRHVLIQSVIKQYLRENFFVGELEVEMQSPTKKQGVFGRMHSNTNIKDGVQSADSDSSPSPMNNQMNTPATGASIGHFNHMITALQDNQGKNIKRKSVMVHNFYKTFKESSETNNDATTST
jgi:hypothetical protein